MEKEYECPSCFEPFEADFDKADFIQCPECLADIYIDENGELQIDGDEDEDEDDDSDGDMQDTD